MPIQAKARPHSRCPPWAQAWTTAGLWRQSFARSMVVVITATAPSVSRQKSSRRSGSASITEASYSSLVRGTLRTALGRLWVLARVAITISPKASWVVP